MQIKCIFNVVFTMINLEAENPDLKMVGIAKILVRMQQMTQKRSCKWKKIHSRT